MESSVTTPRTTYILGAGFSKAISNYMPSTDELGSMIIRSLNQRDRKNINPPNFAVSRLSFEHWLSWLAEKQPFETESDYLAHRSHFLRIQALIADLLRKRQAEVLENPLPQWLYIFVQLLHESESTVVTLNYDSLLETAFDLLEVKSDVGEKCDRLDLTKIFPRQTGVRFDGLRGPLVARKTFDLYKLHGSIDWFWIPGDTTGSSLEVVDFDPSENDLVRKANRAGRGGKSEFLVPPTHSKISFLENAKSKFQWEESYMSLVQSDRVVIAGYSLPDNDSAMASMLFRALSESDAQVVVLNPEAQKIRSRLEALEISPERIEIFEGRISVQNFVENEIALLSQLTMERSSKLWKSNRSSPLAVAWDHNLVGGVTGFSTNHKKGELILHVDKLGSIFNLIRPENFNETTDPSIRMPLTYRQLLDRTKKFVGLKTIRLKTENDGYRPIVGFHPTLPGLIPDPHHPEKDWLIFRPMGSKPPEAI